MRYVVRVTQASERGQDRAAVYPLASGGILCVLADGAGGLAGGDEAADQVLRVGEAFSKGGFANLESAFVAIEERVADIGAGTTAVLVTIENGQMRGISAGDSSAWLVKAGSIEDLTRAQHRKPLVGWGAVGCPFGPIRLEGCLLLASDGLTKYAAEETIVRAILASGTLETKAAELISSVRLRNGSLSDDVSVVLVDGAAGSV